MAIVNPTPETPLNITFTGRWWIVSIRINFPIPSFPVPLAKELYGSLSAGFLQYDGTHLLATGDKPLILPKLTDKIAADTVFAGVFNSLVAEVKRQAVVSTELASLTLIAPDPAKPVRVAVQFVDGINFSIPDCYAMGKTDSVFAGVFSAVEAEIARQAGLVIA